MLQKLLSLFRGSLGHSLACAGHWGRRLPQSTSGTRAEMQTECTLQKVQPRGRARDSHTRREHMCGSPPCSRKHRRVVCTHTSAPALART